MRLRLLLVACAALGACVAPPVEGPPLARAEAARDFDSFHLRRVGLMPLRGADVERGEREMLQAAFLAELALDTPYEIVPLSHSDLAETVASEPYRQGTYRPGTIIDVSRRYNLDGILFGTVVQRRFFPPQLLSVQMDLVAAEVGVVIWSCSVALDAGEPDVQQGLRSYFHSGAERGEGDSWDLALLSPSRFARFAAHEMARQL